jgi:hypothetical protein
VSIRVTLFPEFDVNVTVYSGKITRDELIEHFRALGDGGAARCDRWVSYFDPTSDLSAVDIAALAEIKRITAVRVGQIWGAGRLASAMVCESAVNEPILGVWRDYLSSDPHHPAAPALFLSLKSACDWLHLSEPARQAVLDAIHPPQPPGDAKTARALSAQ